jgi:OOP family OmpA-OmpF porin
MKLKTFVFILTILAGAVTTYAQESNWYLGLGTGFHSNSMKFSELDKETFPKSQTLNGDVISVFAEGQFLKNHMLVIRPQLSYLQRGGKLISEKPNGITVNGSASIEELYYKLNAHYLDVRVPVFFQFGNDNSTIRPYIGVIPIAGFPMYGDASLQAESKTKATGGYRVDLNSANISSTYFAVAPALGVKFYFPVRGLANACFLGLEASYEIGLTDTYGKEKDGKAIDVLGGKSYKLAGTRKFQGFEVNLTVGVPLRLSDPKPKAIVQVPEPLPVAGYEPPAPKPVKKRKPCYTLEEFEDMIKKGESIVGLTICAVDAINFDFGKSSIKRESYPYLQQVARILISTNSRVEVKGHTDNVGSDDYNMELSRKRAKAVRDHLIRQGVKKENLEYSYYGSTKPLTTNDTDEGRTLNRRVEFEIIK